VVIEILTGVLALITAIYAYLTYRMAVASEASVKAVIGQTEAMMRPYVTVAPFVRPHTDIIYIRIHNSGRSAAENVRLSLDKDFFKYGNTNRPDGNLRKIAAFSEPMDSMPPGFELLFALAQGSSLFGPGAKSEVTPTQFAITASYEFSGKRVEEVTRIDLGPYVGSEGERSPIVDELERIRKVLEEPR
jgi:hypothetical protein